MTKQKKVEYNPKKIETKWQKEWAKKKIYKTADNSKKPKYYVLDMFPYPSGTGLHIGHPKGFASTDILSRMKRMQGFNVLHPMGFDAFGLPAENFAIKNKVNPEVAVRKNVANFKKQLETLGLDYDWDREVNTTDPKFYQWTQWIFLKMLEAGLAEESFEPVNWCPVDKTVLANEDLENGRCERCGSEIEKRKLRQWTLKITKYADRLLQDLDLLDWPEHIKESQRNWIGKSEGSELEFIIENSDEKIKVFTTRPDTLFGVSYVVLAPENELVQKLKPQIKNWQEVEKYLLAAKKKSEIERSDFKKAKTGVQLKGVWAINPATQEKVPVWVADYVLNNYGTGAVMAVPAHDERDFEFAKKYHLPIKEVVLPRVVDRVNPPQKDKSTKVRRNVHALVFNPKTQKYLILKSQKFNWQTVVIGGIEEGEDPVATALRELKEETGYVDLEFKQQLGGEVVAEYFAKHKDENRVSYTTGLLFELKSEKQVARTDNLEDEVLWVSKTDFSPAKMVNSELPIWLARMGK